MKQKRYKIDDYTEIIEANGLDNPSLVHRCPYCSNYLWADRHHYSYRFCIYCGRSLRGKKLPFERI